MPATARKGSIDASVNQAVSLRPPTVGINLRRTVVVNMMIAMAAHHLVVIDTTLGLAFLLKTKIGSVVAMTMIGQETDIAEVQAHMIAMVTGVVNAMIDTKDTTVTRSNEMIAIGGIRRMSMTRETGTGIALVTDGEVVTIVMTTETSTTVPMTTIQRTGVATEDVVLHLLTIAPDHAAILRMHAVAMRMIATRTTAGQRIATIGHSGALHRRTTREIGEGATLERRKHYRI